MRMTPGQIRTPLESQEQAELIEELNRVHDECNPGYENNTMTEKIGWILEGYRTHPFWTINRVSLVRLNATK